MKNDEKKIRMEAWIATWSKETTLLDANQFEILKSIVNYASLSGVKLILLDLPIPKWHQESVPWDKNYVEILNAEIINLSKLPGFSYYNIRDKFNDEDFIDATHPRQIITKNWAYRVAQLLKIEAIRHDSPVP